MLMAAPAAAAPQITSRWHIQTDVAAATDGERVTQRRLMARPTMRARWSRTVTADVSGRLEIADDETGLGDLTGYSDIAKPWIDEEAVRLELDEAVLQLRRGATRITLGKQVVAWGALDGFRVTDAFNPVRLREAVAIPNRPDRLALWGARVRMPVGETRLDMAVALDPTVNQLAAPGDAFFPSAPRFRGGLPAGAPTPSLQRDNRNDYADDATFGVRIGRRFGAIEANAVAISGPQADPIFRLQGAGDPLLIVHERRTLFGVDVVRSAGPVVARLEAAVTPHEEFNTATLTPAGVVLQDVPRGRWTTGAGLDWSAPRQILLNAQIVVDHIEDAPADLVRPGTDIVATLRAQRRFHNDATEVRAEFLGSFNDGDGLLRVDVGHSVTDTVRVSAGADLFIGDREGVFGQFRDQSRVRIGATIAL